MPKAKKKPTDGGKGISIDYICEKIGDMLGGPCSRTYRGVDLGDLMWDKNGDDWCFNRCPDVSFGECWKHVFEVMYIIDTHCCPCCGEKLEEELCD